MKCKKVNIKDFSHEEWLEIRKNSIGGSDASSIVGLNSFSNKFEVYCDKKDLIPAKDDTEAMRQGRDFEQYVADRFTEKTGKRTKKTNFMYYHKDFDFISANVDRLIIGEKAGLECKTTSVFNKTDFENGDIPPYYYVQCQHYMAVTGYKKWYLAVLILNKDFHTFEIERNEEDIKSLINAEVNFWEEHILKNIPPEIEAVGNQTNVLSKLYPYANDDNVVISLYHKEKEIRRLVEIKNKIKEYEEEKEFLENILKLEIKDCQGGNTDKFYVEWSNRKRSSIDTKLFKEEQPSLYEKYLTEKNYRVFKIGEYTNDRNN